MILRPQLREISNIGYYLGRITLGLGLTMFVPFIAGFILFKEFNPAIDFLIGANIAVIIGLVLSRVCKTGILE